MMEPIILAVDGGATKTTITIQTIQGKCLFETTASGSNYQAIGGEAASKIINHFLQDAYHSTKLKNIDVAVFAMAGIDTASDLEIVTDIINQSLLNTSFHIGKLVIENDVQAALIGLTQHQPGALLISGTGSIACAADGNGKVIRAGGWGHRASDEGSGYWIGRQILRSIFRAEDGLNQPTILKKLVFEKLQIDSIDQLMNWLYQPDYTNAQTASISSVLPEAVALDDDTAIAIAQQAAQELYLLIKATLTKLPYDEGRPFTLYLNGGILRHNPWILNYLQQQIHNSYPSIPLVLSENNPIEAIVERAKFAFPFEKYDLSP